jgi:alpha-beta hydrolase superfamily lysophospholipase
MINNHMSSAKTRRMKKNTYPILSTVALLSISLMLISCNGMNNPVRLFPPETEEGSFIKVKDGTYIFKYEYLPECDYKSTIYIISGITGINHKSERDLIGRLGNNEYRVVVIHPRGTGYSEGKRGDISDFSDFISDYVEVIKHDEFYQYNKQKIILFSHSMSCAIALEVAVALQQTDGLILVNPPYKLKSARGMIPVAGDYLRYIGYYIFAPHVPVVNMAGDPAEIENEDDRAESVARNNDPLLVKYFSMHYMSESKKIMDSMVMNARQADYPLLLLYGDNDMIVDKTGCDEIYSAWKGHKKNYEIINGGAHGKSTVLKGAGIIIKWMENI